MKWEDMPTDPGPAPDDPKHRRMPRKQKHPHECSPPVRWWKTRVNRSWVCPSCHRRWRIVGVKVDANGRDYPIWRGKRQDPPRLGTKGGLAGD